MEKSERIKSIFGDIKKALNDLRVSYNEYYDNLTMTADIREEKTVIRLIISIDPKIENLSVKAVPVFTFANNKYIEMLTATSMINSQITWGKFVCIKDSGRVYFVINNLVVNNHPSQENTKYRISIALGTMKEYYESLRMLAEGDITIDEFNSKVNGDDNSNIEDSYSCIFTITPYELNNLYMVIYNQDPNKYFVPGFRQGKAPLSSVLKTYGNDVFLEDAVAMYLSLKLKEMKIQNIDNITCNQSGIDSYGCVQTKLFIKEQKG